MSHTRKKYDGDIPGRSTGIAERRDSFGYESKTLKHASAKRASKNFRDIEEDSFSEAEENDAGRYLITYADLITLLLGLFIILYAMSNIDIKKYEKVISAMGNVFGTKEIYAGTEFQVFNNAEMIQPVRSLKNEIETAVQKTGAEQLVFLQENERGITIHVLEEFIFASGRADMSIASTKVLNELSVILKTIDNDIRIEGHTDNIPIGSSQFPSNWHLSVARALNTAYFLIEQGNINPDKVSIVGYSEYKPIASNISPEGRAKNRRVDIVILNNL